MPAAFPTVAYFVGMVVEIVIRAPYAMQRRKVERIDRRVTMPEAIALMVLSLGSFVIPLVYALTSVLSFADYGVSAQVRFLLGVAGLVPLVAALWVFWRSHHDLGANWSPSLEIGARHQLVTHGVYASIRHPMYASFLLWGLAQPLLLQNWIAGFGGLVVFLVLLFARVPGEESMMLDHFGDEYRAYRARTGRVIPRGWTGKR
jgi:protein-S-isoprenylcysteine O-methyltransferase Ste14